MKSEKLIYLKSVSPKIFDFDNNFDVKIFDDLTAALYHSTGDENEFAKSVLEQFLVDDRSWSRVDAILENSQSDESKFYALLILERLVKHRWKLLPSEQRIGIRDYIVQQIIAVGSHPNWIDSRKVYINKLVCLLIEILKFEWPERWPEFIDEIIQSSAISESICLVNMKILRLLAEEIFLYSTNQMNHFKRDFLRDSLCNQFSALFNHFYKILTDSRNVLLIIETLRTFTCSMPYIKPNFIFETSIIETMLERLLKEPTFTNETLLCTAEIMGLATNDYNNSKLDLYKRVLNNVKAIIPSEFNFNLAYSNGTEMQQRFMRILAMFFAASLKEFGKLFNPSHHMKELVEGLKYVLALTEIEEVEIFKICVELWKTFTFTVRMDKTRAENRNDSAMKNVVDGFAPLLTKLRYTIIAHMKRPEEVIIYVNEHGDVVRQHMRDTDSIHLYHICKEILLDLTVLDPLEVKKIIFDRMDMVVNSREFSWNDLNSVGWAVGSISGSMSSDMEKDFLVKVLKCLLNLCDEKSGKPNKAIIASNIMYVVQQYPRFLRPYYKFLKTVMNKLFEFMSETHEGVQDMACDSFLKICKNCRFQLGRIQGDEVLCYLETLPSIATLTGMLTVQQLEIVYEGMGCIVSAYEDDGAAHKAILKCFESYMTDLEYYARELRASPMKITELERLQHMGCFVRLCSAICRSSGRAFEVVYRRSFDYLLEIYALCCKFINEKLGGFGLDAHAHSDVKILRGFKRDFCNLGAAFFRLNVLNLDEAMVKYVRPMIPVVLTDYRDCHPLLREPEVLLLYTSMISLLKSHMNDGIVLVFQYLFGSTISMISNDMQEFPEHRINFFKLIESIVSSCFSALTTFSPAEFDYIVQSLFFGILHTVTSVTQVCYSTLCCIFKNVAETEFATTQFASQVIKTYYVTVVEKVLTLATDGLHSSDIGDHAFLLTYLISLVNSNKIRNPIYDAASEGVQVPVTNVEYLKNKSYQFLLRLHPHMNQQQLIVFVESLFCFYQDKDKFIQHLRDFVIQTKEHQGGAGDEQDLFVKGLQREMKSINSGPSSNHSFATPSNSNTTQKDPSNIYDYHTVP